MTLSQSYESASESDDGSMSQSIKRRSPRIAKGGPAVLSASYLDRHNTKNDLVRRLREVVDALADQDVEVNMPDYPGLGSLAAVLVTDRYLDHKDKEVRLHAVLACMEIFELYAPEPPWDESEVLKIFSQTIRQLANLNVCTSPSQPNFSQYYRLLEQLAAVKIGVVLVDLTRTLESESSPNAIQEDQDTPSSDQALEILSELIKTILQSISIEHPSDVTAHATAAISACIEEFDDTIPIPVLDEILICISAGSVVYVTNPAFVEATAKLAQSKKRGKKVKIDKKSLPPTQIQQTNQSYMIAASIIRRTEDRISTPIANLLNGILNADRSIMDLTNIPSFDAQIATPESGTVTASMIQSSVPSVDVLKIIYELHRIRPKILTTVIGTVASSLQSPNAQRRLRVTKLLGHLFSSTKSNTGVQFHACYREWIRRSNDAYPKIRELMVNCLLLVLSKKSNEVELCTEANDTLVKIVENDPSLDVRTVAVHRICDIAHQKEEDTKSVPPESNISEVDKGSTLISDRLLKAVGNRVSSNHKAERRDAVTGLAQIYHHHYILEKLKDIQSGGDDCDIGIIFNTISKNCEFHDESQSDKSFNSHYIQENARASSTSFNTPNKNAINQLECKDYTFIPPLVFESACFTDATDPEMRNRVVQIVDDVLLGTSAGKCGISDNGKKKEQLTPTSRAVGLSIIFNSLETMNGEKRISSNAFKWMNSMLVQRAKLQRAVSDYIDANAALRKCEKGSEEALALNTSAFRKLEVVAALTSPPLTNSSPANVATDQSSILKSIHTAKDKYIFKLLATISVPTHSMSARTRAFDELPKRTISLGTKTSTWIKCLARRCAMGHFVNVENITHCILLAQESLNENQFSIATNFLLCVRTFVKIFPALAGTKEGFVTLIEMFTECSSKSYKFKAEIKKRNIVTILSGILAVAAQTRAIHFGKSKTASDESSNTDFINSDLKSQLLRLCTQDGTPEQAKNAVYILTSLNNNCGTKLLSFFDRDAIEKERLYFDPLLKALTSSSRMSLTINKKHQLRIVSILTALTALVECSPYTFCSTSRGESTIRFALQTVLLGRGESLEIDKYISDASEGESCSEDLKIDSKKCLPQSHKIESRIKGKFRKKNVLDESISELSHVCQRACAAIDLLVADIRSKIICSMNFKSSFRESEGVRGKIVNSGKSDKSKQKDEHYEICPPSSEYISTVFNLLANIIGDSGTLPSNRDQGGCRGTNERAALRRCAAVNLMKLCDGSLKLENEFLTHKMWHMLSTTFLDEEKSVREAVMEQLTKMLTGTSGSRFAPSLRFLALVSLCPDSDQNHGSIIANGNAASVGRRSALIKVAAFQCITSLRRTCEATSLQCRAISKNAEKNFEKNIRMMLMPEFTVPYALHLLAFRRECPCAEGADLIHSQKNHDGDTVIADEEDRHKILRKRLRWLFEPLVQSLGEGADNISFLLRLTELLGKKYKPLDVFRKSLSLISSQTSSIDVSTTSSLDGRNEDAHVLDKEIEADHTSLGRMKVICVVAREVLLKLVKKDVNLTPYPGLIQIPTALYSRSSTTTYVNIPLIKSPSRSFNAKKTPESAFTKSSERKKINVHFSPDLNVSNLSENEYGEDSFFDGNNDSDDVEEIELKVSQESSEYTKQKKTGKVSTFSMKLSPIPQSRSPESNFLSSKHSSMNDSKDDSMLSSSFDQNKDISDTSISGISDTRTEPEKMTQNSSSSGSLTSSSKKRMIKERKKTTLQAKQKKRKSQDSEKVNLRNTETYLTAESGTITKSKKEREITKKKETGDTVISVVTDTNTETGNMTPSTSSSKSLNSSIVERSVEEEKNTELNVKKKKRSQKVEKVKLGNYSPAKKRVPAKYKKEKQITSKKGKQITSKKGKKKIQNKIQVAKNNDFDFDYDDNIEKIPSEVDTTEKVLKSNTKKKIPTLRKGSSSKKAVISVKKKKITTLQKSLSSDDSKKDTLKKNRRKTRNSQS